MLSRVFFFKQKTADEMRISDWSSDVCSSDLFAKLGKRMTLRVEESRDGGRDLRGIFVNASSRGGKSLAVTAEGGEFLATDDPDVIILRLRNGTLVHNMPGYSAPRVLSFEAHDTIGRASCRERGGQYG